MNLMICILYRLGAEQIMNEIIEIDCGVIKRQYVVDSKLEDSKEDLED